MGVCVAVDWVAGRVITRRDGALHVGYSRPSRKVSRRVGHSRIRESVDGLDPIPQFRGTPPEELSDLPAWLASRGPLDLLNEKLRDDPDYAMDRDSDGWTCLHHAAAAGAAKHVEILVLARQPFHDQKRFINLRENLNGKKKLLSPCACCFVRRFVFEKS